MTVVAARNCGIELYPFFHKEPCMVSHANGDGCHTDTFCSFHLVWKVPKQNRLFDQIPHPLCLHFWWEQLRQMTARGVKRRHLIETGLKTGKWNERLLFPEGRISLLESFLKTFHQWKTSLGQFFHILYVIILNLIHLNVSSSHS